MTSHRRALDFNKQANDYALELRYSQSIIYYQKALSLYLALAKENPSEYCLPIAHIFSNLSIIYLNLEQAKKSDELHQNSLRMYRALVKTNPNKYAIDLARCLIDGVRYLGQHSFTLYEAEIVLNHVKHAKNTKRADKLVRVVRKLHSLCVAS